VSPVSWSDDLMGGRAEAGVRAARWMAIAQAPSDELLQEVRAVAADQGFDAAAHRRLDPGWAAPRWYAVVMLPKGTVEQLVETQQGEEYDVAWRRAFAQLGVAV
jgi:hypothetical protein